jgi:site-specific recombinase XerD
MQTWLKSFRGHLRAEGKSDRTVDTYCESVDQLFVRAAAAGLVEPREITAEHIEEHIEALLDNDRPGRFATASIRFRSLQQFFKWFHRVERATIENPIADLKPPKVPEKPIPLLSETELRRILGTCASRSFEDCRDEALIRLTADSGARRGEVMGIQCSEIDIDGQEAQVRAKGGGTRTITFGVKTARALDRYERARTNHAFADLPDFWLCRKGAFGPSGFYQMLTNRAKRVGLTLHPHQLRHIWAHESMSSGMAEGDVRRNGGWKTRRMLDRYGAAGAERRAREAQRRNSFGDRL